MLRQTGLWQRIRHLSERFQPQKRRNPLEQWPGPGKSPYSEWDLACHGEVITWETYLSEGTRNALVELHAVENLDDRLQAFWQWEPSQPLLERLRISHFEWTYITYTVPDSPTFGVWLPRHELRTRVLASPVPPFGAIEYTRTKHDAVPYWTTNQQQITNLMFEEEATLRASQRLWQPEDYAIIRFYLTLPYNSAEQQRHGRWVQTNY